MLSEREKQLLYTYIMSNEIRLEEDVRQLQSTIRNRKIDVVDCVELILALQRLETFRETSRHILALLRLKKK